jgi:hypothetical protein
MTRLFTAAALWLALGSSVGLGVYDLYVSRGAREYLQRAAEAELGRGPAVAMADVMAANQAAGAKAALLWTIVVSGAGWLTIVAARRGVCGDVVQRVK